MQDKEEIKRNLVLTHISSIKLVYYFALTAGNQPLCVASFLSEIKILI